MRGRIAAFVAIAWLASGAPLESSPFVAEAPRDLAGIAIADNPHDVARYCRDKQLNAIEINSYTYCMRVMPPPVATDACTGAATDVSLMTTALTPAEACEPFLVASPAHHGATMTLVIPVPRGQDVATVEATIAKQLDSGQHTWESVGDHQRTTITRTIRTEADLQRLAFPPAAQLGLAGYVLVEVQVTTEVDPYPHAPCKTEGCGCMKRTACPA